MPYEVLARKWRPQNLSELIGQDSVHQTLTNALTQNRLYPVLLFTGPRGTGKTSTARIIAKILRCLESKSQNSCGHCEECLLIQEGKSLDVIEIDGASNNGVDAIRELRDTANYMPSKGTYKIYIIDEVHMLSNSAFNALLKTLEEPPKHVIFIMATTESHKIPQTVASRCQKLDFHLISPSLIQEHLAHICKTENLKLNEESLWMIAKQAKGSLRDAQGLLDQMITFCGHKITTDKILNILGLADTEVIFKALKSILNRDEKLMLEVLKDLYFKGQEPKLILQSLTEGLRNLLILKVNPENHPSLIQASKQEIKSLKNLSESTSYEDLHFLFDMLLKGEQEISASFDSQMVLEVLLLRFCQSPRLESLIPFSSIEKTAIDTKNTNSDTTILEKTAIDTKSTNSDTTIIEKTAIDTKSTNSDTTILEKTAIDTKNTNSDTTILDRDGINNSYTQNSASNTASFKFQPSKPVDSPTDFNRLEFLDFLKTKDARLASCFEQVSFKEVQDNTFTFLLPDTFSYIKKQLMTQNAQNLLTHILKEYLKTDQDVHIKLETSLKKTINLQTEKKNKEEESLRQQVQEDSFVRDMLEVFQGEVKSVSKKTPDAH